jgi:hypothetical protein
VQPASACDMCSRDRSSFACCCRVACCDDHFGILQIQVQPQALQNIQYGSFDPVSGNPDIGTSQVCVPLIHSSCCRWATLTAGSSCTHCIPLHDVHGGLMVCYAMSTGPSRAAADMRAEKVTWGRITPVVGRGFRKRPLSSAALRRSTRPTGRPTDRSTRWAACRRRRTRSAVTHP